MTTSRVLPTYVQREFADYLACRRLEHGFLRVRCEDYHDEKLVVFSCKHCGFCNLAPEFIQLQGTLR